MLREFKIQDVATLLQLRFVKSFQSGLSMDYVCPFCGHKVLNINIAKDKFRCNACGVFGNSLTLYAQVAGVSNKEAYAILCNSNLPNTKDRLNVAKDIPKARPRYVPDKELRSLLDLLGLSETHRQNLMNRGLTDEIIKKYGFKSVPLIGQSAILRQLRNNGINIEKIPGVYKEISGEYEMNVGKSGILVPSYYGSVNGKLRGIQIRFDEAKKRKYLWMSATNKGGCGSGSPLTYLVGDNRPDFLFITEGVLKAIIFRELTGFSVIGIPGVNNQSEIPNILKNTSAKYVFNLFDMDYIKNEHVKKAEEKLRKTVREANIKYARLLWDKTYKGIDDYIVGTGDTQLSKLKILK